MPNEYDALRQEIQNWQTRKLTVLAGVFALSAGINSFLSRDTTTAIDWRILACVFYLILIPAVLITWRFGQFSTRTGTYLQIFENSLWERRYHKFLKSRKETGLNRFLAYLYTAIALVDLAFSRIAGYHRSDQQGSALWFLFCVLTIILAYSLYKLAFNSYPRDEYITEWKKIKECGEIRSFKDLL